MNRIKIFSVLLSMSMIAAAVPVSAAALGSSSDEVEYVDAGGNKHEVSAYKLDGTEDKLEEGFYYVDTGEDLTYDHTLYISGDVSIIFKQGASIDIGSYDGRQYGIHYYENVDSSLHIFGKDAKDTCLHIMAKTVGDLGGAAIVTDSAEIVNARVSIEAGDAEGINVINGLSVTGSDLTIDTATYAITQSIGKGDIVFRNSKLSLGNTTPDYAIFTKDGDLKIEDSSMYLDRIIDINGNITISSKVGSGKIRFGDIKCKRFTIEGDTYLEAGNKYYYDDLTRSQMDSLEGVSVTIGKGMIAVYIDASGKPAEHSVQMLDADTDISKLSGWYYVDDNVVFDKNATLTGDTYIIIADGKTVGFGTSGNPLENRAVDGEEYSLSVFGQTKQTGSIDVYGEYGIRCGSYEQYGAGVNITSDDDCIESFGNILVIRGSLNAVRTGDGGSALEAQDQGSILFSGGEITVKSVRTGLYGAKGVMLAGDVVLIEADMYGVTSGGPIVYGGGKATVTGEDGLTAYNGSIMLDYKNYNDFIQASSYVVSKGDVKVVEDKVFAYGTAGDVISGTLSAEQISAIAGQKLIPSSAPIARLEGYSLSLDGDIGVNYYLSLNGTDNIEDTYVSFDIDGKEIGKVQLDPDSTYTVEGKTYYCFPVKMSPSQMTMPITATVTNGSSVLLKDDSFTVRDYAEYLLNDSVYDNYAATLLHYGAACQRAFGVNTSDLADKNLDSKYDLDVAAAVEAIGKLYRPFIFDGELDGASYYGSSFSFKSDLYVRCYFKLEDGYSASDFEAIGLESVKYGVDGTGKYVYIDVPVKFSEIMSANKVIMLCDKNDTSKCIGIEHVSPRPYLKYIITNRQAGDGFFDAIIALCYLDSNTPDA